MLLTQKTLLIAHTVDFNSITFLPSNKKNAAPRPANSFHFIDNNQPRELELALLLQDEAKAQGDIEMSLEKSVDGVDYLMATFYMQVETQKKAVA